MFCPAILLYSLAILIPSTCQIDPTPRPKHPHSLPVIPRQIHPVHYPVQAADPEIFQQARELQQPEEITTPTFNLTERTKVPGGRVPSFSNHCRLRSRLPDHIYIGVNEDNSKTCDGIGSWEMVCDREGDNDPVRERLFRCNEDEMCVETDRAGHMLGPPVRGKLNPHRTIECTTEADEVFKILAAMAPKRGEKRKRPVADQVTDFTFKVPADRTRVASVLYTRGDLSDAAAQFELRQGDSRFNINNVVNSYVWDEGIPVNWRYMETEYIKEAGKETFLQGRVTIIGGEHKKTLIAGHAWGWRVSSP